MSLLDRHDEFDKRLDKSLARRSESEKSAIDSARVSSQKKYGGSPALQIFGRERMSTYLPTESLDQYQEELDQLRYDLLTVELEDEVRC